MAVRAEATRGGLLRLPDRRVWAVALAGLFVVWSPAALEAGWWLLLAIGVAAVLSLLDLVADSRGDAVPGPTSQWLALAGRSLAASAIALTAAGSLVDTSARPLAVLLLIAGTVFVLRGGRIPDPAAVVLGALVLLLLATAAVLVAISPPGLDSGDAVVGGAEGTTTAAAYLLLLFPSAAAGRARSTRAAVLTVLVTAAVAGAVGAGLLALLGPQALAEEITPIRLAATGTAAAPLVAVATVAASVLALVVLARRDADALTQLADSGEIPSPFARRFPRTGAPAAAQLAVCVVSVLAVVILDLDALVAFAVGAALLALIVRRFEAGAAGPRWAAVLSAAGALVLLLALPSATAAAAAILLAGLLIVRAFRT